MFSRHCRNDTEQPGGHYYNRVKTHPKATATKPFRPVIE